MKKRLVKVPNILGLRKILGEVDRTVKPWTMWDTVIPEFFKRYKSELAPSRKHNLYANMNAIFSGTKKVTYLYTIEQYPRQLELSFRKTLRRECKTGVRISFITNLKRDHIDWNSTANKNRMKTWKNLDATSNKDVSIYELASEVDSLDAQTYKKASLQYLINANKRRARKLFNVQGIMMISGERGVAFDDTVKEVEKVCKNSQIKIKRITGNIPDYLSTFSPFSLKVDGRVVGQTGSNVVTDEVVARLNSYDQGTVGRGSLYFGTDIYSKKSVLKEPKENSTDAENWLIAAETGGGKSYLCKTLDLQLLGRDDVIGTINDIEGDEYEDMGYIVANSEKVVMLDVGDTGGSYFDPVEIHKTGMETLDKDMFSLSYSYTVGIYKVLVGQKLLDKRDWAVTIIKNGIQNFYDSLGVDRYDSTTWDKTEGKTLFDVFQSVKKYEPDAPNEEFYNDREIVISALEGYLGERSKQSGRFKNKIDVESIRDAKLVINSFGMKGRSEQTVDVVDMALMQLYTALISHLRSVFAYSVGKYNFKVWEEFQRWGGFPGSEETLKTPLSGGRKLGDINIIITNRPSELLETDRFRIFDSITTFMIGAVGDSEVREGLCNRFRIPLMKKELDLIEENRKATKNGQNVEAEDDSEKMKPYSKAFVIGLDRQEFSIAKIQLPASLENTSLFRTGVKVKKAQ